MTEYALYNSNNNSINTKFGSSLPSQHTMPGAGNVILHAPQVGTTYNQYIFVELVDDTSAKINNLYEWSEWNPIVKVGNVVTRTGVYTQKPDNAGTRNTYERLVWAEFDRRMSLKVVAEVSVGRTVEIKFNEEREFRDLLAFGMSAQMHVQAGTTDTYTLRDINGTDQVLSEAEMVAFFQAYANKRNNKRIDAHALIDNGTIQYDYDDGSHW